MPCYGSNGRAFEYGSLFPEHSLETKILNVYLTGLIDGLEQARRLSLKEVRNK